MKDDHRKNHRFDILGVAHIKHEPEYIPLEAQVVNISHSGVRLYVREALSGRVAVSLYYFADGTKLKIAETIQAEVAWVQERGSWYSIGLRFQDLNFGDHPATLTFLDEYAATDEMGKRPPEPP